MDETIEYHLVHNEQMLAREVLYLAQVLDDINQEVGMPQEYWDVFRPSTTYVLDGIAKDEDNWEDDTGWIIGDINFIESSAARVILAGEAIRAQVQCIKEERKRNENGY